VPHCIFCDDIDIFAFISAMSGKEGKEPAPQVQEKEGVEKEVKERKEKEDELEKQRKLQEIEQQKKKDHLEAQTQLQQDLQHFESLKHKALLEWKQFLMEVQAVINKSEFVLFLLSKRNLLSCLVTLNVWSSLPLRMFRSVMIQLKEQNTPNSQIMRDNQYSLSRLVG